MVIVVESKPTLSQIDFAIAISLGWEENSYNEELELQKELEYFVVPATDGYALDVRLINPQSDLGGDVFFENHRWYKKIKYYLPPLASEEDQEWPYGDHIGRWLENGGIPKFSENAYDLDVLMQEIERDGTLDISRRRYQSICTITKGIKSVAVQVEGNCTVNLLICQTWLKFHDIEI